MQIFKTDRSPLVQDSSAIATHGNAALLLLLRKKATDSHISFTHLNCKGFSRRRENIITNDASGGNFSRVPDYLMWFAPQPLLCRKRMGSIRWRYRISQDQNVDLDIRR